MNPKHFHTPLSTRARCPVCHEAVYSRSGIHPQCAVRKSEPPKSKLKAKVAASLTETGIDAEEIEPANAVDVIDLPTTAASSAHGRIPS
jgi:Tat protein secretion system quality control protein TatD with DNase activity